MLVGKGDESAVKLWLRQRLFNSIVRKPISGINATMVAVKSPSADR